MRAAPALLLVLAACSRGTMAAPGDAAPPVAAPSASSEARPAGPPPSSAASAPAPAPLPGPTPREPPAPAGEAKRTTVTGWGRNPLLAAHRATLQAHFGAAAPGPFLVQRAERAGGGSALLVTRADESDPIVLAVDRDRLVFSHRHPVGGITPPALHLAIGPGPEQGVALFAYVATLHLVAARMWADDGNPFAENVAMQTDACDALSAAYARGWGWLVACATKNGTRAQLLREDLTAAWGEGGAIVGTIGPVVGRATLAFEDDATWSLTQRARAVGGDRVVTFRYGRDAQPRPSSSTSNTSVEFGGMTGGKPRAP